ncbi:PQQ-dependent sugar dehydrogenase [Phenylobacterium sp.]|jgi:glucose/arabinose dehydrogenase|uniref:PQQ-dependent sugar dehydrogenase n=1 Tax=Phenylobacterium sp. TaxID=1871053 RepID=UPI000C8E4AA5|nr:PQQ-dependent sugar dehydrogenase [Phenylobacterium sp.]MAK80702.1 glucose dehydrogenase [Phenylobacterium sp.]|tara:strand:- start:7455 stop:8705 length:1251 start_codon:yes stop_codon:yes gene_type:complete
MRNLLLTTALAVVLAACGGTDGAAQPAAQSAPGGEPWETRPANAPSQTPAFAGQTRAPEVSADVAYEVVTVAEGLDKPWAIAFLPDGRMLVTEKPGRLRIVNQEGQLSDPVSGLPEVDARDQGGLLDVVLDTDYAQNKLIYWSYAEPRGNGTNSTAVARGRLVEDGASARVTDVQVIFQQNPAMDSTKHYGNRLVFDREGHLLIALGERSIMAGRVQAQDMNSALGKVVRINRDGSIPADNPFVGQDGVRPEIFASGVRNVQAAALHPKTGQLWEIEHGARGGDELNIIEAGKNYGWPTITYGLDYSGQPIGEGLTAKAGLEQPAYYWDPVIGPSGMIFYQGDLFPAWKDSLFVGALRDKQLVRLTLDGDRVVGEERLLTDVNARIREVEQGPDGAIYVATDSAEGKILKLVPKTN